LSSTSTWSFIRKTIRLSLGSVSVDVLKKLQKDSDGNYFNDRMEQEMQKRAQFIETRKDNGKKGGRPKKLVQNLMVT